MLLNTQRCMNKNVNCHLIMRWGGRILLNRTWRWARCSLSLSLLLEAQKISKVKVIYHLLIWVFTVRFIHSLCDIKQVFWFFIYQSCALAVPRSSWHLTFAPRQLGNLSFWMKPYAGHHGFHRFRRLDSQQFFLEHILVSKWRTFSVRYYNTSLNLKLDT